VKKFLLLGMFFAIIQVQGENTKIQINLTSPQQIPKTYLKEDSTAKTANSKAQPTQPSPYKSTGPVSPQWPAFNAAPFTNGQLFYNAVPSTPAVGSVIKVIETKDDKDYIAKIYKLKAQVGPEIKEFLKTMVLKEGGQVESTTNTETGDNYLVVTAPVFQFPFINQIIDELDKSGTSYDNSGDPSITYMMKNRLASELAPFIKAEKLSRDGTVFADDTINMLYICDVPSQFMDAMDTLPKIDIPPEMVRIEAQIIEIEMDDDFNFGLDWNAWKAALPESVDMSFDFERTKNNAQAAAIGNPTGVARYAAQSFNLNGIRPRALADMLNYLIRKGKAKILSRPVVVARNRQLATISSVDQIYYANKDQVDKKAEVGITLTITPTIGTETMTLDISAKVNSLMGWSQNNTPRINTRSTTANVVLKDGEMFSLSGLRKDAITKEDDRIPFFGSIPFIGYLFRHEIDVKRTYEIVVLLTPKKVTPTTGAKEKDLKLAEEVKKEIEKDETAGNQFLRKVIMNK